MYKAGSCAISLMRALTIIRKCASYRMDQLLFPVIKRFWIRRVLTGIFFLACPSAYLMPAKFTADARAARLRHFLQDLGPVFVKFGQTLSTRRDLLPQDIADELALLQDQVPPFSSAQAQTIIETELGKPVSVVFTDFTVEPLASASVAQVHSARLKFNLNNHANNSDGEPEVIIKIIRPDIKKTIKQDIGLMYLCAGVLTWIWRGARQLHLVEVVQEYDKTIHHELDLRREAANATQLKHNFKDSTLLYVPQVYWEYTTSTVMTMERIYGIAVTDLPALQAKKINLQKLAERGTEIFYTQVFRDAFFHADMHPGNIFVDPAFPEQPRYLGVDFGIMGSLSEADQYYLAHNLLAFFRRDYKRVAALHIESGWVAQHTNLLEMEAAIRTVCEPIFAKPLKDISFGKLLMELFSLARQFHMEVQPQLILLQKTLLNVEGLGRQIYPELNLWQTGKPFLEKWLRQRLAPWSLAKRFIRQTPDWLDKIPDLPGRVLLLLEHLELICETAIGETTANKKNGQK